jgi:L-malate glycosyltransferase
MPGIHQLLAGFSKGDAISNEALVFQHLFEAWGYPSNLYAEQRRILPELRDRARDVSRLNAEVGPDDVVLLHLSIGSVVNEAFVRSPGRKAILYHNITPADYFRGVQEEVAIHLEKGRRQAAGLAGAAAIYLADSQYNAEELMQWGASKVDVLPLILDLSKLREGVDRRQLDEFQDGKTNILFVGRICPNKRIEHLLYAFYYYQNFVNPNSRLILAGSYSGMESYYAYQLTVQRELKLRDVVFTGSVPQAALNACFRSADVFLCMSEHEGFCIPVLEAMVMDVPVVAYAAAAVPETMDGAGVLVESKDYRLLAELMGALATNASLRSAVLEEQRLRVKRYEQRDLGAELKRHLALLIDV